MTGTLVSRILISKACIGFTCAIFLLGVVSSQFLTVFDTSELVKNTPLSVVFSTFFSVFGNAVKNGLS